MRGDVRQERPSSSQEYYSKRESARYSNSGHIPVGTLWQTLDGTLCRVSPATHYGVMACEGCHYLNKDGTVTCHMVPPCKWWTRSDKKNIIYKPINNNDDENCNEQNQFGHED